MSYIDYPPCGNALEMEEAAMGETGECPHCGGEHEGVSFACGNAPQQPPWVGQATRIDERALVRASVKIGEGCSIWAFATVHEGVVLGDGVSVGELTYIGQGTRIGSGTRIGAQVHVTDHMEIGRNCFIAPGARFANDNDPKANNPHYRRQSPIVEDDVVICEGVQINPGVRLGRGCRIGSGAVVTRDVPPYETWVGVPARPHARRR